MLQFHAGEWKSIWRGDHSDSGGVIHRLKSMSQQVEVVDADYKLVLAPGVH